MGIVEELKVSGAEFEKLREAVERNADAIGWLKEVARKLVEAQV